MPPVACNVTCRPVGRQPSSAGRPYARAGGPCHKTSASKDAPAGSAGEVNPRSLLWARHQAPAFDSAVRPPDALELVPATGALRVENAQAGPPHDRVVLKPRNRSSRHLR
jgi:hypothetical protein